MRKRIVHQTEVVAEGEIEQKEDVFLKGDKADILKWMAGLWIVEMAAIIGLYIKK